jgi:hypothetical protein
MRNLKSSGLRRFHPKFQSANLKGRYDLKRPGPRSENNNIKIGLKERGCVCGLELSGLR